jgi:RNA-directed DNA polymerase
LQHALYRAAKADPGRRFHALYDKLSRRDVLQRAWEQVRRNQGAPGIDQVTIQQVEQYGVDRLLDKLAVALREGSWRPLAARRVLIPSPARRRSSGRCRSYRHRSGGAGGHDDRARADLRGRHAGPLVRVPAQARRPRCLAGRVDQSWQGRRWVVCTDIADCFSAIPHSGLMSAVKERICDRRLLKLLGAFLHAGVLQDGAVRRPVSGTPQGGCFHPCCATSTCTGWTGRGVARTGRWCATLTMVCHER